MKNSLLLSVIFFSSLFSFLYAEEEHAQVNSRPIVYEKPQTAESPQIPEEGKERSARKAGYFLDTVHSLIYSPASHSLLEVSPFTDTVRLEDGSIWRCNPSERSTIFQWNTNDLIIITQNNSWFSSFSSYRFQLCNKTTGSTVQAELTLGPILGSAFTQKAVLVDSFNGLLVLDNGSRWEISYGDNVTFTHWVANDTIMIGINKSWFSSGEFILVDVETNSFVKANLIQ